MSFKRRPSVKNSFFPSVSPDIWLLVWSLHRIPPALLLQNCKAVGTADQPGRPWLDLDYGLPMQIGHWCIEREITKSNTTVLGEASTLVTTCTSKPLDPLQGLIIWTQNAVLLVMSWLEVVYIQHAEIPSVDTSEI